MSDKTLEPPEGYRWKVTPYDPYFGLVRVRLQRRRLLGWSTVEEGMGSVLEHQLLSPSVSSVKDRLLWQFAQSETARNLVKEACK